MQIHLSEQFSGIEVIDSEQDSIVIRCALWPNWNELHTATHEKLTLDQLKELEDLFRTESQSREFEIEDQILKIRFAQAVAI
jgi:hypothetical protein